MVPVGILHAFHDMRLDFLNDFSLLFLGEALDGLRMRREVNK